MMGKGTITAIYVAPKAGAQMELIRKATCVVGCGLLEDRYGMEAGGSFSKDHDKKGISDDITLYNLEDVMRVARGMEMDWRDIARILRRNLIVEDLQMRALLVAKLVEIITPDGFVLLEWAADCAPCVRPGTLAGVDAVRLQRLMWANGFGGERLRVKEVSGSGIIRPGQQIEIDESGLPKYARRR